MNHRWVAGWLRVQACVLVCRAIVVPIAQCISYLHGDIHMQNIFGLCVCVCSSVACCPLFI